MMLSRRKVVGIGLGLIPALLSVPAFAGQSQTYVKDKHAIGGYDPVGYFTQSQPVKGSNAHAFTWQEATWLFASTENLETFKSNPEKYAPQFGGYCAYAVSKGYTAKTEPNAWTIHDGKLYLNYNLKVRDIWKQDISGNVALANKNWPAVLNK